MPVILVPQNQMPYADHHEFMYACDACAHTQAWMHTHGIKMDKYLKVMSLNKHHVKSTVYFCGEKYFKV